MNPRIDRAVTAAFVAALVVLVAYLTWTAVTGWPTH